MGFLQALLVAKAQSPKPRLEVEASTLLPILQVGPSRGACSPTLLDLSLQITPHGRRLLSSSTISLMDNCITFFLKQGFGLIWSRRTVACVPWGPKSYFCFMIRHYWRMTPRIHPFSSWNFDVQMKSWILVPQDASWSVSGLGSLVTPMSENLSLCRILCFVFSVLVSPCQTGMNCGDDRISSVVQSAFPWWHFSLHVPWLCRRWVISRLTS